VASDNSASVLGRRAHPGVLKAAHRLRSNCPPADAIGILPSVMGMPSLVVVMLGPSAPVADVDTVATLLLLVFAAGVGWVLWRRK